MAANSTPDPGTKPEVTVRLAQPLELTVHVAFNGLPIATYGNDGPDKGTVKYAPPFLRFPMQLTTEDAAILENILYTGAIALVGFEIKDSDGHSRFYRSILARE